jgi:hypothetical protein
MRRVHDMGGLDAGPVVLNEHEWEDYAKRSQAMSTLLRVPQRGMVSLDEMRRNNEDLGDGYLRLNYDERVVHSIVQVLLQRGVISIDELGAKLAEFERDGR